MEIPKKMPLSALCIGLFGDVAAVFSEVYKVLFSPRQEAEKMAFVSA